MKSSWRLANWFHRYTQMKDCPNNKKQKKLPALLNVKNIKNNVSKFWLILLDYITYCISACHSQCFSSISKLNVNLFYRHQQTTLEKAIPLYLSYRAAVSLTVPGGQEFHFHQIAINFSYFSSSFWPSGWATRLAHPGRPWLRHCFPTKAGDKKSYKHVLYDISVWECM